MTAKPRWPKLRRRKSGGRAVKDSVLTWGDLASRLKGRRREARSEKSAEVVVAAKPADAPKPRREGPNEKESETTVSLEGKGPQMSRQLELPLASRGEAPTGKRSEEAPTATHGNERSGASGLMETVCERREPSGRAEASEEEQGQSRHRRDDGGRAAGAPARALAASSASNCSRGRTSPQPVKQQLIPKSGGGMRRARHPDGARPIHPAGPVAGPAAEIRPDLLGAQLRLPTWTPRARRGRARRSGTSRKAAAGWWTWIWSKFFDRVNHDVLMGRLAKRIGDRRVLGLIRRYLEAGIMANGVVMERHEGTPQGGPLSPLLANVLLDEVDKELEKRGHAFVRYADDCNVYVRSRRAGERVMGLLRRLYAKLRLRVNESKSAVARAYEPQVPGLHLLGGPGRAVKRRVASKALAAMKDRVREITRRTRRAEHRAGRARSCGATCSAGRSTSGSRTRPSIFARPRRMDPPSTASDPPQAVEAGHDHLPRAARPGTAPATRPRRSPPTAAAGGSNSAHAHQHRLPHPLLRPAGTSPAGRVTSTLSNRPMRTRMPGGVAGVLEGSSGPYADQGVIQTWRKLKRWLHARNARHPYQHGLC